MHVCLLTKQTFKNPCIAHKVFQQRPCTILFMSICLHQIRTYNILLCGSGKDFPKGKGWYSSLEKEFTLNKKTVQKIINKIKKELTLLEFSCWSTEQLNYFTHHVLAKFVTSVYSDMDYINNMANILEKAKYVVYKKPTPKEIVKFFNIAKEKTVVILPSISKQPETDKYFAPIEKLLINFLMENRRFGSRECCLKRHKFW